MPERTRHIGDGVYATYDGYGLEIRVDDHRSPQVAYLEPETVAGLQRFLDDHARIEKQLHEATRLDLVDPNPRPD
jgi:hypothetical protein